MRVLWFNHRDPLHPQAGGAEVRIYEIGRRLVQSGHSISLVCERWASSKSTDFLDGIKIFRVAGRLGLHLKVPFMLNALNDCDIIVDDVAHAVPWFSPLFTRKPVICQVHHVHQEVLDIELSAFLARLISLGERSLRHIYRAFIVVSASTKLDLINRLGVSRETIKVITNGVDSEFYRPIRKSSEPTLLCVGRLKKYKRVDHILRAFRLVKRSLPNAKLFVVGDGDHLEILKSFCERMRLPNVVFTGRVSEKEKVRLMAMSWGIVSASLIEGWGMSIVEGAACATPAVAYDVAGLRDSIQHNRTGLLVEDGNVTALADALFSILRDDAFRHRLGSNALQYAKRFSWKESADRFMKVLELEAHGR